LGAKRAGGSIFQKVIGIVNLVVVEAVGKWESSAGDGPLSQPQLEAKTEHFV
jgi:hypothetical protein